MFSSEHNRSHFPVETLLLGFFLVLTFFPLWVTAARLSYIAYNNASDTFLYLDIARNIATGKGFVVSFNGYQYWPGAYHSALAYVHVGLPLFLSVFYPFFKAIEGFILVNAVLAVINCFLIFRLVKRITENKIWAVWVAVLAASTVCMQNTVLRILTEQLSFLVTLAALCVFAAPDRLSRHRILLVGFLLAAGMLIRSSSILLLLAFALALGLERRPGRERLRDIFFLCLCPLILFVAYQVLVYARTNAFFPEYPRAFKNFYVATWLTGGNFFPELPVVRPVGSYAALAKLGVNAWEALRVFFCTLRVLFFLALWQFIRIFRQRDRREMVLLMVAVLPFAAILVFYPYVRLHEFELVRFLLPSVVALLIIGIRGLSDFGQRFLPRTKALFFHAVLFVIFASNYYQSYKVLEIYWHKETRQTVGQLEAVPVWLKQNTSSEDLIAAQEVLYGLVYLDRPVVAVPFRNTLSQNNLEAFIRIYKPAVIIYEKVFGMERVLGPLGYAKVQDWLPESHFDIFQRR
ncbi:MAG: glycosyltransferase family 39 protein [Candidatus Omnitrophota bacterium]